MPRTLDRLERCCDAIREQIAWRNGHRPAGQRIAVELVAGALLIQNGRCVLLAVPNHEIAALDSDDNLHRGVNARLQTAIAELNDLVPEEGVSNREYLKSHCIPLAARVAGLDSEPIRSGGPA